MDYICQIIINTMSRRRILFFTGLLFFINSYSQMRSNADLIVVNTKCYMADQHSTVCQAFAVRNGKIAATGTGREILDRYTSGNIVDAGGKPVFPGFIDAHCHFMGYALSLRMVDLRGIRSFDEILDTLSHKAKSVPGEWIVGRGWDHNLWPEKIFPDRSKLDSLFPHRPVVLIRIDGHVVLANGEALKRAGIGMNNKFTPGEVEVNNGRLTGILSEDAGDFVKNSIPEPDVQTLTRLLKTAELNCFAAGLTGVSDAGLNWRHVHLIDSLQQSHSLHIHVYAMLEPTKENIRKFVKSGPYKTQDLTIRSIKMYADGSLGSRTALLKKPYSDDPGKSGIQVTSSDSIRKMCRLALKYGYQVNVHAIGDRANRIVLDIFGEFLKTKNDLRWRIEHAQVVDPADLPKYKKYSVIPSVQTTHATSDMNWAGTRLGPDRVKWAYAYRDLMQQNGWLANGTDFPVENISPLLSFYAAVARQDVSGNPPSGFQIENCLLREDALRSITIWAAKAGFDDAEMGSLEPGKKANFVILDGDFMEIPYSEIPKIKVLKTFMEGKLVFSRD